MIDKIRAWAQAVKDFALYILGPILAIAAGIYYLVSQNKDLKQRLQSKDGEKKLDEIKNSELRIDHDANDAATEYRLLRDSYLRGGYPPSGSSPGGQGSADSNPGSGLGSSSGDAPGNDGSKG